MCAGIHMSHIPSFPYRLLWKEQAIRSVANLTRQDAREFLSLAAEIPLSTHVQAYALTEANCALSDLRSGRLSGAAVLVPQSSRTSSTVTCLAPCRSPQRADGAERGTLLALHGGHTADNPGGDWTHIDDSEAYDRDSTISPNRLLGLLSAGARSRHRDRPMYEFDGHGFPRVLGGPVRLSGRSDGLRADCVDSRGSRQAARRHTGIWERRARPVSRSRRWSAKATPPLKSWNRRPA